VGDKVILHPLITCGLCRACRDGDDVHCDNNSFPGLFAEGGFAQYMKTGARSVIKIDESLEPTDVAPLADAGLTAYHAIKKALPLLYPGTTCAVIGAGGLGHIGIQCLRAMSATRIVVLDANPAALELAREWGADETVLVDGNQVAAVQDYTQGRGAEVVLDFVGEGGAEKWGVELLKRKGHFFVIGYGGVLEVPTMQIILTEINFIGNLVGSYNDLVELMDLAAQGKVKLHTSTYPLDDINQAIEDLNEGRLRGRGILVP
jgi:NAD+-dependent secondary alcohol dehydrogenase Adh1